MMGRSIAATLAAALAGAFVGLFGVYALAQDVRFPTKNIHIIVGNAAGGPPVMAGAGVGERLAISTLRPRLHLRVPEHVLACADPFLVADSSWFKGANIPGKADRFLLYLGASDLLPQVHERPKFALIASTLAGLGMAWHHFHATGVLSGVDAFDLGLSLRLGSHLAAGAVLRDLATRDIGGLPVQRRYEAELVVRLLGTAALEAGHAPVPTAPVRATTRPPAPMRGRSARSWRAVN